MTITICASKSFDQQAEEAMQTLRSLGHKVHGSKSIDLWPEHGSEEDQGEQEFTQEYDRMRRHFVSLKQCDAILVLNYEKNGIAGYVGGGVLMEMGFAHVQHKPIYLLNPLPDVPYRDEIELMRPIVIDGDFKKIPLETAPTPPHALEAGASVRDLAYKGGETGMVSLGNMKRVKTYDVQGKENGFLMELLKDGRFTKAYLTCVYPGRFKGYHLHRVRETNYVAVRGTMRVILYVREGTSWERQEHVLESTKGATLHIPANVATGFESATDEEAWMINFPEPPYDPELKDEQVEYTEDELERGVFKN